MNNYFIICLRLGDGILIETQLSKKDLSSSDKKELLRRVSKTGGKISKSKVAKKASKIKEVQKNIKNFNVLVKRVEKVVGKKEVQKKAKLNPKEKRKAKKDKKNKE